MRCLCSNLSYFSLRHVYIRLCPVVSGMHLTSESTLSMVRLISAAPGRHAGNFFSSKIAHKPAKAHVRIVARTLYFRVQPPCMAVHAALQDEIKSCTAILMHTSSPASFSNYRIFISKVRVPSSSNKKIINIGELSPTVNNPLERTAEGNPRVQHVDQVQNQTKNPFTYLMSTVASFKTPGDLLYCLLFNLFLN